jgi:protein-disulfide isomerase
MARSPGRIAVIFRHWPLAKHPAAYSAARAAECAAAQDRFVEFHDALFRRQEQIEGRDWWSFARGIGGVDSSIFIECVQSDARVSAIERDIVAAERTGSPGTPTILINGLRFNRPPSPDEVAKVIDSLAAGGRWR